MSASILYKDFLITSRSDEGAFRCKVVRKGGRPFALGRRMNHEIETSQFATEAEAIQNAKLIASLAIMQK